MRTTLIALALCAVAAPANAGDPPIDKVSFYFAAHADDWQLFMNPSAFQDVVAPATKTVFIHVTAGDVGLGAGNGGRRFPLYQARENGADLAIRFMANANSAPAGKVSRVMDFNGHAIERTTYRHTVNYFLRLPDGGPDGAGYPANQHQSLSRLSRGEAVPLVTVDRSATYRDWTDLLSTIRAIVDFERDSAPKVQFNVAELDATTNPHDHPDHQMTARAALEATRGLDCAQRRHYVDYASSGLPENLDAQQRDMESAVFGVTLAGVLALDHAVSWAKYNKSFVGRNYFRVEEGTGRCDQPTTTLTAEAKR
jgi:hypothetical protein